MMSHDEEGILTIRAEPSFFTVLWNQKWVVAGIVVIAATIGFGLSLLQPATYGAQATVIIADPNTAQELTDQMGLERSPQRNAANQALFMESIDPSISATPEQGTGTITVSGTSTTGAGAVDAVETILGAYFTVMQASADAAATELLTRLDEQQAEVENEIAQLEAEIIATPDNPTLRLRQSNAINELRVIGRNRTRIENQLATYGNGVQAYTAPKMPAAPTGSAPVRNAFVAAVLGILVATGVAWVRGTDA